MDHRIVRPRLIVARTHRNVNPMWFSADAGVHRAYCPTCPSIVVWFLRASPPGDAAPRYVGGERMRTPPTIEQPPGGTLRQWGGNGREGGGHQFQPLRNVAKTMDLLHHLQLKFYYHFQEFYIHQKKEKKRILI